MRAVGMSKLLDRALIVGHVMSWTAFSLYAYMAAMHDKFASCWTIVPTLLFFPLLTIAIFSFPYVAIWIFRASQRPRLPFMMACHGVILTMGTAASFLAAVKAAGPVHCL